MRSVAVSVVDRAQMGPVYRGSISDYRDYIISVLIRFDFYTVGVVCIVNDLIPSANTLLARKAGDDVKITAP